MLISFKDLISLTVPHYCIFYIILPLSLLLFEKNLIILPNIIIPLISLSFTLMGLNVFNMIFDLKLDKINKPNRPLPSKRISKRQAIWLGTGLILIGILMILLNQFYIVYINLLLIFTFFIYTHPKIYLKKYLLSSPIFGGIFYGLIPILIIIIIISPKTSISIPIIYILMIMTIASLKDIEDVQGEIKHKIHSIPQIIGKDQSIKLSLFLLIFLTTSILILALEYTSKFEFVIPFMISLVVIHKIFKIKPNENYKKIITQSKIVSNAMLMINFIFLIFGITAHLLI